MAARNLAPLSALQRGLVPLPGSFAFGGDYGKASLDMALAHPTIDTIIEATLGGVSAVTVWVIGDGGGGSGVVINVVGNAVVIHYEDNVSTIAHIETAIGALGGADDVIGVKTGGTGATKPRAVDDIGIAVALTPAVPPVVAGLKGWGFSVAQTDLGEYTITFTDEWLDVVSLEASLQLAATGDQLVLVGPIDLAAKTVKVWLWDKSNAAKVDIAVDDDNRLNFCAQMRNSAQLPTRG